MPLPFTPPPPKRKKGKRKKEKEEEGKFVTIVDCGDSNLK
jgi:hypothetical protein